MGSIPLTTIAAAAFATHMSGGVAPIGFGVPALIVLVALLGLRHVIRRYRAYRHQHARSRHGW